MKYLITYTLTLCLLLGSCYSFKGTSIPPSVNNFYVDEIRNNVPKAPVNLGLDFRQTLINKIRNESRLDYVETDPQLEFSGQIVRYEVVSVAPQDNTNTPAYNQLEIDIKIEYIDNTNKENNWEQTFTFFDTFGAGENIGNVEDALISSIFEEIVEKVFNRAFTNW